jgi:mycothiol synthase
LCHYPHDSATLSLCDEIGLLVMAEIPLYWWGDQDEDHSAKLSAAKRQLTRLIDRDYNHPSIIFWSVSNETQERQSYVVAGNAELVALAKKLDPSRFATHVSNQWTENPHFEEDDLCCINGYPTWGGRRANPNYTAQEGAAWWKKMLTALHAKYPDKPILVTEFGYPAIHEVHDGCIAEEEQARVLEAELPAILSESYVSGATLWCWADHPWIEEDWICRLTTSPFGVVGRDRKSKAGLSATRRLFREAAQRPSLLLRKTHLNNLPAVTLPAGYSIRNATPKDVEGLATCLQKAFPEMTWTADNACAWLIHDESVKATFVIEFKGEIVATASARLLPNEFPGAGYIHWVGADPSHRGKNLGYLVSLATLHEFVHLGCQDAVLHTDDFRVPAIKVYLKLGFRPEYAHATHPRRWSRLLPSLPKIELP